VLACCVLVCELFCSLFRLGDGRNLCWAVHGKVYVEPTFNEVME
jgi:hypothetical protein